jgi:hypothetical protein
LFEAIKTGNAVPVDGAPAVTPAMSLQDIANKHTPPPLKKNDGKKPTGEHVNALKEALSSLVPKNNQDNKPRTEPPKQNVHEERKQEQRQPEQKSKKHPNEIPEDELRKMLSI